MRLLVRTAPDFPGPRRHRAGLGPFGREAVVVEADADQAALLRADPMLVVTSDEGPGEPESAAAPPRRRRR